MKTTDAIKMRILHLCEENKFTVNRLAEYSGLPVSSLKGILYGRSKNPTVRTIKILCDGMGITLAEFFSSPEFEELEQEIE